MTILTKFTVATEPAIQVLARLTAALAMEKYSPLLDRPTIDEYIAGHFAPSVLIGEVNSMSNQWLIVYAGDEPAGYARISSKGKKPRLLEGKRAIRIADLGVLGKYPDPAVRGSLFEKCLVVCRSYEGIWIHEFVDDALIAFFESHGFVRQDEAPPADGLSLNSVCLIKQLSNP